MTLDRWWIKHAFTPWRVNGRGSMSLMICRGHIRTSKGTLKFFYGWWFYGKIDIKFKFCTFAFISAQIWKYHKWVRRSKILSGVNITWSIRIQCKNSKSFTWGITEANTMYFLGPKHKNALFWMGHPHLHIKSNLYECSKERSFQIFKQNQIISICSSFIAF